MEKTIQAFNPTSSGRIKSSLKHFMVNYIVIKNDRTATARISGFRKRETAHVPCVFCVKISKPVTSKFPPSHSSTNWNSETNFMLVRRGLLMKHHIILPCVQSTD
jgi:hypothetical protein